MGPKARSLSCGRLPEKALEWRRDPGTLTPKIYLIDNDRDITFPEDFLRDMTTIWSNLAKDNMWIVLSNLDTFRHVLISEKKLLKLQVVQKAAITEGIEVTTVNVQQLRPIYSGIISSNFNISHLFKEFYAGMQHVSGILISVHQWRIFIQSTFLRIFILYIQECSTFRWIRSMFMKFSIFVLFDLFCFHESTQPIILNFYVNLQFHLRQHLTILSS